MKINKIILLDPGHGGLQTGKIQDGVKEKDINLEYALSLGQCLRQKGFLVLFTRDRNISFSLSERLRVIKEAKPNAFISIHCNAVDSTKIHGSEVYYRDEYDIPLAHEIQRGLEKTDIGCRGSFQDVEHLQKHLAVLNDLKTPSVLIELGYMSNTNDENTLLNPNKRAAIAELLASSITVYFIENGDNNEQC